MYKRRVSSICDAWAGLRTDQLHDDTLDQRGEADLLAILRVVEVLGEYGSDLGVGVCPERVPTLLQDETELFVCGPS